MLKKLLLTTTFLTILNYGFNSTLTYKSLELLDNSNESTTEATVDAPNIFLSGDYLASVASHKSLRNDFSISIYDDMIRDVSEEYNNDWRLLSAIAYHESRFKADAVSRRGASGLMQIMPSVAKQFDVAQEHIFDPYTNITLANKLLKRLSEVLIFKADTSLQDRLSIILASYNGGIGHVLDARRLARLNGEDANSWDVVARYLQLKASPEYYEHEVVKCGRFTGSRETLAYVRNVIGSYQEFSEKVER